MKNGEQRALIRKQKKNGIREKEVAECSCGRGVSQGTRVVLTKLYVKYDVLFLSQSRKILIKKKKKLKESSQQIMYCNNLIRVGLRRYNI